MDIARARRAERSRHEGLAGAVFKHLVASEADRAYYETALEVLWSYGEHTPLDAAVRALKAGDTQRMNRALGEERLLEALWAKTG